MVVLPNAPLLSKVQPEEVAFILFPLVAILAIIKSPKLVPVGLFTVILVPDNVADEACERNIDCPFKSKFEEKHNKPINNSLKVLLRCFILRRNNIDEFKGREKIDFFKLMKMKIEHRWIYGFQKDTRTDFERAAR